MKVRNKNAQALVALVKPRLNLRSEEGWSLAATIVMMLVITMFVGAMWSSLLPAYKHVVGLRYKDVARAVDEGAVDSMLAQMNTHQMTPPAALNNQQVITTTTTQGGVSFNVDTTIKNLGSGGKGQGLIPTNCVLYNANRPAGDQFFSLTTKVKRGVMEKQLTVLMCPIPTSTINPFTLGPAFGVSTVNEVGLAGVNGYNLPTGWTNPYQFADTTVASGVHWQIGTLGNTARSQVIAGSQFEFWQPGNQPSLPPGTAPCTYEPFTQIMGNVYSNYTAQSGANGNGYWMRNQLSDIPGGSLVPGASYGGGKWSGGDTDYANVFGAANGTLLNGQGVPTGFESSGSGKSIGIPNYTAAAPSNGSGSTVNPNWGFNATNGTGPILDRTGGNMPVPGTSNFINPATPYTGGYITSPGPGQAGKLDTWLFPQPPIPQAPGAPVGVPAPATGGLGVPNQTGTYFSSSPLAVTINGGTLRITNTATSVPATLSAGSGQTVNIPPGNYNLQSLQVVNGGKIIIDDNIQGQTQFFMNPPGSGSSTPGSGTNAAVYVDNNSSINYTGLTAGTGFKSGGTKGYGADLPTDQIAVDTAAPLKETSGSCLNLVFNSNSNCNMLFGGNVRALVNAPSSNINVGYQPATNTYVNGGAFTMGSTAMAKDANFFGAIIGGNVSVVSSYTSGAGAYLHYDVKLKQIDSLPGQPVTFNKPLGWYDPWMFKAGAPGANPASQWRVVSWVEDQ